MSQGMDYMHSTTTTSLVSSIPLTRRDQQLVQTLDGTGLSVGSAAASICIQVQSYDCPEFGTNRQAADEFTG